MPSASPLLSCPNAVSELDYGYRHLHAYPCPTPPPPGPRLQPDYDPFKFLSAMTEQSLTGNFASHHPSAHASQATHGGNHFLFAPSSHMPQSQNGFSSPPAMTSSPTQYYGSSQPPTSSMCCMYGSGSQYSSPSGSDFGGESFSLQQPPLPHQQSPSQPLQPHPHGQGDGERKGEVKAGLATPTAKKGFLCSPDLMDTCEDGEAMLSWTRQHPEHWTRTEVLDWLFSVAQERGLDMHELRGEAFQSLTGAQLCGMDLSDFTQLEPNYGHVLYLLFKKLLAGVHFTKPCGESPSSCPPPSHNIPQGGTGCTELRPAFSSMSCDSSRDSPEASPVFHNFSTVRKASCPELLPHPDGYWKQERLDWKPERSESLQSDVIDIQSYDFDLSDPPSLSGHIALEACPTEYDGYTPTYPGSGPMIRSFYPPCPYPPPLPRRRPGRPRVKSLPEDDERSCKEKKAKNQHLWEFIYETLLNPLYNPQYLRWENQREGVFRFVQSEAVAQLWGSRKNNENMTYEKLSRAMRHYYKRGILERVEGRRLVYKFSRKAIDRVREIREKRLPSV